MIESQLFEEDYLKNVCISDNILSNQEWSVSILTGQETNEHLGDVLFHSDENLLLIGQNLEDQNLKITAHRNKGSRKLRAGDQKFASVLLSVHQLDFDLLLLQI